MSTGRLGVCLCFYGNAGNLLECIFFGEKMTNVISFFFFKNISEKLGRRTESCSCVLAPCHDSPAFTLYRSNTISRSFCKTQTQEYHKAVDRGGILLQAPPQRRLRKQEKGQQTLYSLVVMNNRFYFKVRIRCFLPKKVKVRNFHKTKRKRTSMILLQKQLKYV